LPPLVLLREVEGLPAVGVDVGAMLSVNLRNYRFENWIVDGRADPRWLLPEGGRIDLGPLRVVRDLGGQLGGGAELRERAVPKALKIALESGAKGEVGVTDLPDYRDKAEISAEPHGGLSFHRLELSDVLGQWRVLRGLLLGELRDRSSHRFGDVRHGHSRPKQGTGRDAGHCAEEAPYRPVVERTVVPDDLEGGPHVGPDGPFQLLP
jgi:hypothetical protein